MHSIAGLQCAENEQVQRTLQKIEARRFGHWCRPSTPISTAAGVECQHHKRANGETVHTSERNDSLVTVPEARRTKDLGAGAGPSEFSEASNCKDPLYR